MCVTVLIFYIGFKLDVCGGYVDPIFFVAWARTGKRRLRFLVGYSRFCRTFRKLHLQLPTFLESGGHKADLLPRGR